MRASNSTNQFDHDIMPIDELQIFQFSLTQLLIGTNGRLYIHMVGRSVVRHAGSSSDVTLAFEYAQVIQVFSN